MTADSAGFFVDTLRRRQPPHPTMPDDFNFSNAASRERGCTLSVVQTHFDRFPACSVQSFSRYLCTSTCMLTFGTSNYRETDACNTPCCLQSHVLDLD